MSTNIANRNDTYVERYKETPADPYAAFADEGGPGIVGQIVKCTKGEWVYGQDSTEWPAEKLVLAIVPSMYRGWLKYVDKQITDARIGLVAEGYREPPRYTLGDQEEANWPAGLDGKPSDPWSRRYQFQCIELTPPHATYTCVGQSWGARLFCQELCAVYAKTADKPAGAMPVISLTTTSRMSKSYGKIVGPWFKLEGWATVEDVKAGKKAKAKATPTPEAPPAPKADDLDDGPVNADLWTKAGAQ